MRGVWTTVVGVAIIAALVFVVTRTNADPSAIAMTEQQWSERIARAGVEQAQLEFLKAVETLGELTAHDVSHAFGAALYLSGGTLQQCPQLESGDEFSSSGCSHEYIGRLMAQEGTHAIQTIKAACDTLSEKERYLCEHAMGHGLLAWFGYDKGGLSAALDACTSAEVSSPNCYRAVFMEYDFRDLLDEQDGIRMSPESELHNTCSGLKGLPRQVCVYWQPNWWLETLRRDGTRTPEQMIARMRDMCLEWPSVAETNLCNVGVGFTLFYLHVGDVEDSAALCTQSFGPNEEQYCRMGVASRYRSIGRGVEAARRACDGLVKGHRNCLHVADDVLYKVRELPGGVVW